MKRTCSMMIGAGLALLFGTTASAATTVGRIVSSDASSNRIAIQTDDGRRLSFTRNDATRIEQGGAEVALADLREGSRVTVTTAQDPTDEASSQIATRVEIDESDAVAADVAATRPGAEGSVRVDSAGEGGSELSRTVQVDSADYDEEPTQRSDRLPDTGTPLWLIAWIGAGSLAAGVALRLRGNRR